MKAEKRDAMQLESVSIRPHVHKGMTCMRCGAPDCVIIPNVDPTFTKLQGVGASQHVMLCSEGCLLRRWECFKCDEGADVPEHAKGCEIGHPGAKEEWRKKTDHETLAFAVALASRGIFLPAFFMDSLFPGFKHADPPDFAAFKVAQAATP